MGMIIMAEEKHDGEKQKINARLVARELQEIMKPQSNSPTVSKETFKILMAISIHSKMVYIMILRHPI